MTEEVIDRYVIEIREFDKDISGDVPLAQFIITVDLLGTVKIICYLTLFQIFVFPQIPDPAIHDTTPLIGYHTAFCCIDKYRRMR